MAKTHVVVSKPSVGVPSAAPLAAGVSAAMSVGVTTRVASSQRIPTGVAGTMVAGTLAGAGSGSGSFYALPSDRATLWKPGVTYNGGLPSGAWPQRTELAWASGDQRSRIQAEINAAHSAFPNGVIVRLGAGSWNVNSGDVTIPSNVVVKGAGYSGGLHTTIITCTNGATNNSYQPGARGYVPIITIGGSENQGTSIALSANATKGAYSVTVASAAGLSVGQYVMIDELSGAAYRTDPQGIGQIWANTDFSVVWQRHNPGIQTDDPFPDALSWFCRNDRPQNEIKKISAIVGTTITFDSPFHKDYFTSRTAQLTPYTGITTNAGVEDIECSRGSNGNIRFEGAASCWVKSVNVHHWLNENICINNSFRCELRDSYLHDACWPEPGGAGYAISLGFGSSEILIENNISYWACKVMVARCAGSGSVFGYNYCDVAFDSGNPEWQEVHLNASHMLGCHHVLFEGNYAPNADSDKTHGNSTYHTFFRNHLSSRRKAFTTYDGLSQNDATNSPGMMRCAGMAAFSRYMSWVGNVLGLSGAMSGFIYEDTTNSGMVSSTKGIWVLGWDDWYSYLPQVQPDVGLPATTLRDFNFDYLTNQVHYHGIGGLGSGNGLTAPGTTLPDSMYITTGKPSFFGANQWPWVDPVGATKLYTLPAKARFDAGTPFA